MCKLVNNDLPVVVADFQPVADFKKSITLAIRDRFQFDSEEVHKHPFVISTVLDHSLKGLDSFPVGVKRNAYSHMRQLVAQPSVLCCRIG